MNSTSIFVSHHYCPAISKGLPTTISPRRRRCPRSGRRRRMPCAYRSYSFASVLNYYYSAEILPAPSPSFSRPPAVRLAYTIRQSKQTHPKRYPNHKHHIISYVAISLKTFPTNRAFMICIRQNKEINKTRCKTTQHKTRCKTKQQNMLLSIRFKSRGLGRCCPGSSQSSQFCYRARIRAVMIADFVHPTNPELSFSASSKDFMKALNDLSISAPASDQRTGQVCPMRVVTTFPATSSSDSKKVVTYIQGVGENGTAVGGVSENYTNLMVGPRLDHLD